MTDRRSFLKTAAAATTAAACASLLTGCENGSSLQSSTPSTGGLIVPKAKGLRITGTFLDEISHDIPHQNWGPKEWEQDFRNMKAIGIDTVIMIRSGYRKFITCLANIFSRRDAICLLWTCSSFSSILRTSMI